MRTPFRALLLAAALLPAPLLPASGALGSEPLFAFVYANANEDMASGGHAAIRLGDDVFHFQYDGGLLGSQRDDWRDFQLDYRGLQNRTLRVTRVDVDADTFSRLRSTFGQRHLARTLQLDLKADVEADAALVDALLDPERPTVELPGLGFFAEAEAPSPRIAAVAAAIEVDPHSPSTRERIRSLEEELRSLPVRAIESSPADFGAQAFPRPRYAFHRRYADLVAGIHAMEILRQPVALREDALADAGWEGAGRPALEPRERERLQQAANELAERLVALARGTRPDWGRAFLLGLARLAAIEMSLDGNRWVLLDALGSGTEWLRVTERRRALLPALEAETRSDWETARRDFAAKGAFDEGLLASLEENASRWWELRRAVAGAERVRIADWPRLPRGVGRLERPIAPDALVENGASRREAMRGARFTAEREARAGLGYRLVTRNCVSELFVVIDDSLAEALRDRGIEPDAAAIARESEERLGGYVSPATLRGGIPFVSSGRVRDSWRVAETRDLPSLRRVQLEALRAETRSAWIALRESNTLTSTLYAPGEDDSFFVFFTDGSPALRPFLGAVNFAAAIGGAGVGLLTLPFDGGRSFRAALRGALFSLPELGFQNIRKGSNDWIAPELRPVDP